MKNLLIIIASVCICSSCTSYYKTITQTAPLSQEELVKQKESNKYFILRNAQQAFAMNKIEINKPENTIQCNLDSLPNDHKLHLTKGTYGKMIYDKGTDKDERAVLNEVHIYLSPGEQLSTGPFSFAIDKLNKIEVLEQDKEKTKRSNIMGAVITTISISVGLLFIVGLSFGSGMIAF